MPPLETWRKRWNIGPDDFVLPAFLGIVVALFGTTLLVAALLGLCLPASSNLYNASTNCTHCKLQLTVPLSVSTVIEVAFIASEVLILVFSALGPIKRETRKSKLRNRLIPHLITIHSLISTSKLLAVVATPVCFYLYKNKGSGYCKEERTRLLLAEAVVVVQVVVFAFYIVKICVFSDPFGVATPSLLAGVKTDSGPSSSPEVTPLFVSGEWRLRHGNPTQLYSDSILLDKQVRTLRSIFCCLGVRGQVAEATAIEDGARLLYCIFSETNLVLSDLMAGFTLLRNYQQEKKMKGETALFKTFRTVIFQKMSVEQRCGLDADEIRPETTFQFSKTENQVLLEDLVYYIKYAMGVFGWPLYIHDHKLCGFCRLCSVTRCRCKCTHHRARRKNFLGDNLCMCNIAAFRKTTKVKEKDILYASFDNSVFLAPYIVCLDHKMKAIVVSIRGSMSFKDLLTCLSFSQVKLDNQEESYVHGGMFKAANNIMDTLMKKRLLYDALENYLGYAIVVTGHSLGGGVASVLAILIEKELNCPLQSSLLKCYAYSPPSGILSFALAERSKSFITSVVLGNDMVPRLSLHSLLHLKESILDMLERTTLPKYQVLLCSRKENFKKYCCLFCTKSKRISQVDSGRVHTQRPHNKAEVSFEGNGGQQDSLERKILRRKTLADIRAGVFKGATSINAERQRKLSIFHPLQRVAGLKHKIEEAVALPCKAPPSRLPCKAPPSSASAHRNEMSRRNPTTLVDSLDSTLEQHCYVDERTVFLPCFTPGRILHLQFKNRRRFGRNSINIKEVPRENLSVIVVDRGMRGSHFVTKVFHALRDCKTSVQHTFDLEEMERIRREEETGRKETSRALFAGREGSSRPDMEMPSCYVDLTEMLECSSSNEHPSLPDSSCPLNESASYRPLLHGDIW